MVCVALSHEHWKSPEAQPVLEWINTGRTERTFRPTVVVVIMDHDNRFLVVRHNTEEGNWGLLQGEIEVSDVDPVAAALREAGEEAGITREEVETIYPHFSHVEIASRRLFKEYTVGSRYIFVGFRLKEGVSLPRLKDSSAFLQTRWCDTEEEAMHILRSQPDVVRQRISLGTWIRLENSHVPTLKLVREARINGLLDLLPILTPIM